MPTEEVIYLRPGGWGDGPAEERWKVSCIDITPNWTYNHYMLFFPLADDGRAAKERAVDILRRGLETTLGQARYFAGTIEKDPEGGHSFVKTRDTTVKLVVRWFDGPEDEGKVPTYDEMQAASFGAHVFGDVKQWSIPEMLWKEGDPVAHIDNSPVVAGYQINLVRGGLLFSMHSHHLASDVVGWANYTRQLAGNCAALASPNASIPFPAWDPARMDVSRFARVVPADRLVDMPPPAARHPGHPDAQVACLFHLPRSRMARLKQLATPPPGAEPAVPWISSYDAMCAQLWRVLTRARAPLYRPDPGEALWWAEAVNMRDRMGADAALPARMLRNVLAGAFSDRAAPAVPAMTVGDVLYRAPLWRLAAYVRRLTASVTAAHVAALVEAIAPVRDKSALSLRLDAQPPMSVFVTDHRPGDVSGFDFGFGRPVAYRHLWGESLSPGLVLVYAPLRVADPDEGPILTVTMEKELVPKLVEDPEFKEYFEYRGVD